MRGEEVEHVADEDGHDDALLHEHESALDGATDAAPPPQVHPLREEEAVAPPREHGVQIVLGAVPVRDGHPISNVVQLLPACLHSSASKLLPACTLCKLLNNIGFQVLFAYDYKQLKVLFVLFY